jgi:CubicO group peptidase (beta-lactamase class C family)
MDGGPPVPEPKPEVDPAEVGVDPTRLARADAVLDRYVDAGRLPGYVLVVARHGSVVHVATGGLRDVEQGLPALPDTLWRIYSMTKPVTSVAAMMLHEEGAFELTDLVSRFIPAFADVRVFTGGTDLRPATVPATEPIRIWHLLTHTAGLTYGFHRMHPVDAMLRARGYEWGAPDGVDLAAAVDTWAGLPLLFEPGSRWNYSCASDVLGRVVEVASGVRLDAFLAERVLTPLGMTETAFHVGPDGAGGFGAGGPDGAQRLARLYLATADGMAPGDSLGSGVQTPPALLSGGGGLVSTAHDYHRFTQFLLRRGELDGVRLLGPRTVDYMTRNHLPGGADLDAVGTPISAESPMLGVGFGLGFAVVLDAAAQRTLCSPGEYSWGGAASTAFWVDPAEGLTAVLMTQLLPSSALPLRTRLRQAVYAALVN